VNPLRIPRQIINELEYNLILCYTGKTRLSSNIVQKQIDYYKDNRTDTVQVMEDMKKMTIEMKNALLVGKLEDFAEMLHISGIQKRRMNPFATDNYIDELYEEARLSGVIGGKVLGAGGGGYLLLYCPIQKRTKVTEKLEKLGGSVMSFCFESHGLQTWNF
jgi:D-glycero-alpha-D-manno-heptose-7-phosphate kinase